MHAKPPCIQNIPTDHPAATLKRGTGVSIKHALELPASNGKQNASTLASLHTCLAPVSTHKRRSKHSRPDPHLFAAIPHVVALLAALHLDSADLAAPMTTEELRLHANRTPWRRARQCHLKCMQRDDNNLNGACGVTHVVYICS